MSIDIERKRHLHRLANDALHDDRLSGRDHADAMESVKHTREPELSKAIFELTDEIDRLKDARDAAFEIAASNSRIGGLHLTELARAQAELADLRSAGDETETMRQRDHDHRELARVQVERDRCAAALAEACSLLDDAVQLRDDAFEWFPRIAELRKVGAR